MGRKAVDMDKLAFELALASSMDEKKNIAKKITDIAYKKGIYSSSINGLYMARLYPSMKAFRSSGVEF